MFELKWQFEGAFYAAGQNLGLPDLVVRYAWVDQTPAPDNAELNMGREYAWSDIATLSVEFRVKRDRMQTYP